MSAYSCQLVALNSAQTTLRTYCHTQLKECANLQWFQDALHTRSVSIIHTELLDPLINTYSPSPTNDTSIFTIWAGMELPVQSIDPYTSEPNSTCIQSAVLNVVPFQEHLMHFWYTREIGNDFEDYDRYGHYEGGSASTSTTTSMPTTIPTPTPIPAPTFLNRKPFFPPPTTNPNLPEGFPHFPMSHFNMTHVVQIGDVTYYQYYLTGFPNSPSFDNFCVGHQCIFAPGSPLLPLCLFL